MIGLELFWEWQHERWHQWQVFVSPLVSEICFPRITTNFKSARDPSLDSHAHYEINNSCNDLPILRFGQCQEAFIMTLSLPL
ncbi:hypothetical protein VNO77_03922 [Canavalia gladiata]|uniref:Uncharacterized protein n=1 Tax=Canavalia gladiata TaxID=3824 RepID=A0AAN9N0R5_CANGL